MKNILDNENSLVFSNETISLETKIELENSILHSEAINQILSDSNKSDKINHLFEFLNGFSKTETNLTLNSKVLYFIALVVNHITNNQTEIILQHANEKNSFLLENLNLKHELMVQKYNQLDLQNQALLNEITPLRSHVNNIQEKEKTSKKRREKHQMRDRKKMRDPISFDEFIFALNYIKKNTYEHWTNTEKFTCARDRIALFLLFFSGLRVQNLLHVSLQDLINIFLNPENKHTSISLIKKKKSEFHTFFVSRAVAHKFFFGEINLIEDFYFLHETILNGLEKKNISLHRIPFYTSYKFLHKPCCRNYLNDNINTILKNVVKNCHSANGKILSSHSF